MTRKVFTKVDAMSAKVENARTMQTSSEICPDSHNFLPNLDKKYCSSRLLLLTVILCVCASQGILGMGDRGHLCCLQTEHLHHHNLCPDQKLCQMMLI